MTKRICLVLTALAFALIGLPARLVYAHTGGQFAISPTKVELNVQPGEQKAFKIVLQNHTASAVSATTQFLDFEPMETGEPSLLKNGEKNAEYGIADWLSGKASEYIPSDTTMEFDVTIKVPAGAKPQTRYGAVAFRQSSSANGMDTTTSVAALVLVNIGTPTYAAKITNVDIREKSTLDAKNASTKVEVTVENTGEFMFTPKVTQITIVDDENKVITVDATSVGNTLPKSKRSYQFEWKGELNPARTYRIVPNITLPDGTLLDYKDNPVLAEATVKQEPPKRETNLPALAIAGAALLAACMAGVYYVRRKKNAQTVQQPVITAAPAEDATEQSPPEDKPA